MWWLVTFLSILGIALVAVLIITLSIVFTSYDRDFECSKGFQLVEEGNNTIVDKNKTNELDRQNMTLSDIVIQNDTIKDTISTYNDTDAE